MMQDEQNPYSAPQSESAPNEEAADLPGSALEAVNRRFTGLLGENGGPMLLIWGVICVLGLPSQLLNVQIQQSMLTNPMGSLGSLAVIYALGAIVGTLYYTSLAVMKKNDAIDGDWSFSDAASGLLDNFLPTLLTSFLCGIAMVVGTILCIIPGLIAIVAFFAAPFITATYGTGPVDAMRTSIEWVKAHSTLVAVFFGAVIGYGFLMGIIGVGITMAVGGGMAGTGVGVGYGPTLIVWAITSILSYFLWLYLGSILITISRAEDAIMGKPDPFA